MSDGSKKRDNIFLWISDKYKQFLAGRGGQAGGLVPIPISSSPEHYRSQMLHPSWWEACRAWVRYQTQQTRWDIERTLARILRRRWY